MDLMEHLALLQVSKDVFNPLWTAISRDFKNNSYILLTKLATEELNPEVTEPCNPCRFLPLDETQQ